jgi:hypothetical protein
VEEQDWKNIVNELADQIKQISIERAVARADLRKAATLIELKDDELRRLNDELALTKEADVRTSKNKE